MLGRDNDFSTGMVNSNSRQHVMFLLSSLGVGGSERKTVRIANAMAKSGRAVTIGYLNGPHTLRNEVNDNVAVVYLDRKGKFGVGALRRLISYIPASGVSQICCINTYPLLYGFFAGLLVRKKGLRVLATTNETSFVRKWDKLKMILYAPMLRRVSTIVFGSAHQKGLWVNQYGLDAATCTYVYNGVDSAFFRHSESRDLSQNTRQSLGIPIDSLVIGSVGRFRKEKQYQVVILACEELRKRSDLEVHCVLIGGGYEEPLLRHLVDELGCGSYVHLLDTEGDVRPYLEAMDIFVLSSISETFSNAVLEAMAMTLPVVLPRVGGCPEMVRPGETGYVYEPGDISGFVDYLGILSSDEDHRIKMGQAARRYVETDFRFESMVAAYVDLFEAAP